jgi:hypothetical protein
MSTLTESAVARSELYRSVGGTAFTELDSNGQVSGMSLADQGQAHLITGTGGTVLIQFQPPQQNDALRSILSTDGGETWQSATFIAGGQRVQPVAAPAGGRLLAGLAIGAPDQTALSRDGSTTWQALPAGPASPSGINDLWVCLDGTLIAVSTAYSQVSNLDPRLYRLAPGAASWMVALTLPGSAFVDAIAYDASGHPSVVWASYANTDTNSWALVSRSLNQ